MGETEIQVQRAEAYLARGRRLTTWAEGARYWLSLPWPCRLLGHTEPVRREHFNEDAGRVEEAWLECGRCRHFFGYAPDDPRLARG